MIVRVFLAIAAPSLRARVEQLLHRPHVHAVTADDGDPDFSRLVSESYDIGILDRMPVGDAADVLLGKIRRLPDRPGMLLMTEGEDPGQRAKWLAAGILAVIDTQVGDEILAATIDAFIQRRRHERLDRLSAVRRTRTMQTEFISDSPAMTALLETARRVAMAASPVLVLGETGVGKERLAMVLHTAGPRSNGPLVAVNCAAIPSELFESELFGHHRGAFTGALRARRGKFELADRGTIFLDEVGDVPLHLQAKLLRVLQEGRITPLGSDTAVDIDTRVIAATNRDLRAEMLAGRFRRDLYYRLGVVELTIPPLRERPEDIPALAHTYLREFRRQLGREVESPTPEVTAALLRYDWPGNVRELVNVIERAVLLCRGEQIGLEDLPESVAAFARLDPGKCTADPVPVTVAADCVSLGSALLAHPWKMVREALLREGERAYLEGLLRETRGRIGATAERAGISSRSLFEKMRRHGLRKEDYR